VLADLDPSSSHHLLEIGLLLALLGGGVVGLVGIASLLGRAGRAVGSGLAAAGALFCAGFVVMIIVAHWGTF
jgi:hypothetical protein